MEKYSLVEGFEKSRVVTLIPSEDGRRVSNPIRIEMFLPLFERDQHDRMIVSQSLLVIYFFFILKSICCPCFIVRFLLLFIIIINIFTE
jgi:hypothetical protein